MACSPCSNTALRTPVLNSVKMSTADRGDEDLDAVVVPSSDVVDRQNPLDSGLRLESSRSNRALSSASRSWQARSTSGELLARGVASFEEEGLVGVAADMGLMVMVVESGEGSGLPASFRYSGRMDFRSSLHSSICAYVMENENNNNSMGN